MRFLAILILSMPPTAAFSDPPMSHLYGADITIGRKTDSGYLGVFEMEPVDVSRDDILIQVRKYKKIGFVKDVVELRHLFKKEAHVRFGALVSTSAPMRFLDTRKISRITRVQRPFDQAPYYGQIGYLANRRAKLLAGQQPVFVCSASYSENPALYWVSYSSTIGKEQLAPICNSIEAPQPKVARGLLRDPKVFNVSFESD